MTTKRKRAGTVAPTAADAVARADAADVRLDLMQAVTLLLRSRVPGGLLSYQYRTLEDPESAVWHLHIAGNEYLLILQPTDLPDRDGEL